MAAPMRRLHTLTHSLSSGFEKRFEPLKHLEQSQYEKPQNDQNIVRELKKKKSKRFGPDV